MSNERALKRRISAWAKEDQLARDEAVRAMLSHAATRKYLAWLLEIGKIGLQPFTNNALTTSFACGELNVGQQIFAHILSVDADGYVRLIKEQEDERNRRAAVAAELNSSDDGGEE